MAYESENGPRGDPIHAGSWQGGNGTWYPASTPPPPGFRQAPDGRWYPPQVPRSDYVNSGKKTTGVTLKRFVITFGSCSFLFVAFIGWVLWYETTPEGQAASKRRADERVATQKADDDKRQRESDRKRQEDEAKKQAEAVAATTTAAPAVPNSPPPPTTPAVATIPSLIGSTYRDAMKQLDSLGFKSVKHASATPGDTRQKNDLWVVVGQLPNPGSSDVPVTAEISLSLSPTMPPPPTTAAPPPITVLAPGSNVSEDETYAIRRDSCTKDSIGAVYSKGLIVNKSNRRRTFTINVEFQSSSGVKVGEGFGILNLDPRQTGAYETIGFTSYQMSSCVTSVKAT